MSNPVFYVALEFINLYVFTIRAKNEEDAEQIALSMLDNEYPSDCRYYDNYIRKSDKTEADND